ncbi:MAG: (2Fe-2S)-binding protein, partial [Armatimonadota bacterium]
MPKQLLSLTVNGERHEVAADPRDTLLRVLRDYLGLTGTKNGCGEGECGACTVLLDGRAICSCITLALDAEGCEVTTIEGIAEDGHLHPLQEAFVEHGAIQCGFCTPGMIVSAK